MRYEYSPCDSPVAEVPLSARLGDCVIVSFRGESRPKPRRIMNTMNDIKRGKRGCDGQYKINVNHDLLMLGSFAEACLDAVGIEHYT